MAFDGIIDRFVRACAAFERPLREVRADQWDGPTPCSEWTVRMLVNHMAQGNLNYVMLLDGGSAADFLRRRDLDVLGADPVGAFVRSAAECAAVFARPGVLDRVVDYPLGRVTAAQALAVRTTDSVIHTWDLARAIGADETLDPARITWIDEHLDVIYQGLAEAPTSTGSTHRFFAAPTIAGANASRQERLLRRMRRTP